MSLDLNVILNSIKKVRENSKKRGFIQSVELIINLQDVDPKKPEERIHELVELPHKVKGGGKVCVIASGELALKAKEAGADLILRKEDLEALAGNKRRQRELARNYDFFLAEAPLMPLIGKILGSILGPRGKMPAPVPLGVDVKDRIERHRRMVMARMRGQPIVQCKVGAEDMLDDQIAENALKVIHTVESKLKRGLKNIKSIYLKMSMGPSVRVEM